MIRHILIIEKNPGIFRLQLPSGFRKTDCPKAVSLGQAFSLYPLQIPGKSLFGNLIQGSDGKRCFQNIRMEKEF